MAFEEGKEQLTCPECGAEHAAKWSRMPVRERARIGCRACPGILYSGNTVRDYYEVRLIHRG